MAHSPAPMQLQGLSTLPEGQTCTQASCLPSPPLDSPPLMWVCSTGLHTQARHLFTANRKGTGRGCVSAHLTNPLLMGLTGQTNPNKPRTGDSKELNTARQRFGESSKGKFFLANITVFSFMFLRMQTQYWFKD